MLLVNWFFWFLIIWLLEWFMIIATHSAHLSLYFTESQGQTLTSNLSASGQWASHQQGNTDLATDGATSEHGCCPRSSSLAAASLILSTSALLTRRRLFSKWIISLCKLNIRKRGEFIRLSVIFLAIGEFKESSALPKAKVYNSLLDAHSHSSN